MDRCRTGESEVRVALVRLQILIVCLLDAVVLCKVVVVVFEAAANRYGSDIPTLQRDKDLSGKVICKHSSAKRFTERADPREGLLSPSKKQSLSVATRGLSR